MKKLREYRNHFKLSQEELAKSIGISQPTLSDYENGIKRPRPGTALRIEKVTGIDRNYLIFGDPQEDTAA